MKTISIFKGRFKFGAIVVFASLSACGSPHYEDPTALANVDHSKEFFSNAPESSISEDGRTAIRVEASKNRVEWYQKLSAENKSDGDILPCYYQLAGEVSEVGRQKVFMGVSEVDHIQFKAPAANYVWTRGMSDREKAVNKKRCNDAAFAKSLVDGMISISSIPLLDYSKNFLSVAPPDCLGVGLGGCSSLAELQKKVILLHAIDSGDLPFDPVDLWSIQEPSNP